MEENRLTDQQIRRVLKVVEQRRELLSLANDSGVTASRLKRIINDDEPINFDERFLICAVIGELE